MSIGFVGTTFYFKFLIPSLELKFLFRSSISYNLRTIFILSISLSSRYFLQSEIFFPTVFFVSSSNVIQLLLRIHNFLTESRPTLLENPSKRQQSAFWSISMRFSEQYDSEASSRTFVHAHPRAYIINHVCLNNRITQTRLIRTYNDSVDSSFKHGRSVYRCFLQLQLFSFLSPFFFSPFSLLVEDLQRSERRKLKQEKVMPSHLSRRLNALTRHRRLGFERWKSIRIWIIIFSLRRSTDTLSIIDDLGSWDFLLSKKQYTAARQFRILVTRAAKKRIIYIPFPDF